MLRAPFRLTLNVCKDGTSTTSMGNLDSKKPLESKQFHSSSSLEATGLQALSTPLFLFLGLTKTDSKYLLRSWVLDFALPCMANAVLIPSFSWTMKTSVQKWVHLNGIKWQKQCHFRTDLFLREINSINQLQSTNSKKPGAEQEDKQQKKPNCVAGRCLLTLEEFSDVAFIAHNVFNASVGVHDCSHTVNASEL